MGTDFDAIVRSVILNVTIGETEKDVADKLAWTRAHYEPRMPADELEPFLRYWSEGLIGTPEQIVEKLKTMSGHGLDYSILYFPEVATDFSGVELFQQEVVPALS